MDSEVPAEQLHSLANFFAAKFKQEGRSEHIDEAITLDRSALKLSPPSHRKRPVFLTRLSIHLGDRYNRHGAIEDLNEAITLGREALALCPSEHPYRSTSLNNLGVSLSSRYNQLGEAEDLDDAIVLGKEALTLRPPGHPDRPSSLDNLSARLFTRYKRLGAVEDLNESISLCRDALALRPQGHPHRSVSLNNLGVYLSTRYKRLGEITDLDVAIVLGREALALRPPGHSERSSSLDNLSARLSTRYNQLGAREDLDEAITLCRDALALRPTGHPLRSVSLSNLGVYISTRYKVLGDMADLDEAVILGRDALSLRPLGHPDRSSSLDNLAARLCTRFDRLGELCDLDEAISLSQEALSLRAPGNPYRSWSLRNLALSLGTRFACSHESKDREELFSLYAQIAGVPQFVSSADLSAARAWVGAAEEFQHSSTLLAYETCFQLLLHHLAALPSLPRRLDILKGLTSSLAVDAFSACLRNNSPHKALELLEQGRGVFLGQLYRLRFPLDDVLNSGSVGKTLADRFIQITSLIRNVFDSPSADEHDHLCHLNESLQEVISNIRELPGLSRFLLPSLFSDLKQAAREGPVIIVNASAYSCDALIVLLDRDPVHIPLSITRERVRDLSSEFHAWTIQGKSMDVTKYLAVFLRKLWDEVVFPIVESLQTIHPAKSRIWWCPTAEFSLLPLHAAGPYRKKGEQKLSDLYISSYTLTLTALIRARRPELSDSATQDKRFVAIGQSQALGHEELSSVGAELANIGQRIHGLATFTCLEGSECTLARVTDELSNHQWVHLACRSRLNRDQLLASGFMLYDGPFTIERIIHADLQQAQFAYLSASNTTVGDEESPDELIHLASAIQFAGFRSVIGTMGPVEDSETVKITSRFYDYMVDDLGRLDHTRAAFALHKTMVWKDIPFSQRVHYIHMGA